MSEYVAGDHRCLAIPRKLFDLYASTVEISNFVFYTEIIIGIAISDDLMIRRKVGCPKLYIFIVINHKS